ncbi:MAG TPA: bifunctional adenosylcobinamide kinase/adenosylcobinamide-phosphate guanylyltransferase [Clostridia bacterium]|nr:bifunctional adenosylcobinamide kinase/adenosylcobinamide-phosphate guanylyltransferase [Clostridia bacterium]
MILILGGAYQGKRAYAEQTLGIPNAEIADLSEADDLSPNVRAFDHFEQWVLRRVDQNESAEQLLMEQLSLLEGKVVLCEDIQCGVVPIDARMRAWREENGRCLCLLARRAQRVIRVCCGLPLELKP